MKRSPELCNALLSFHVITGCGSNSTLSGLGKKKHLIVLLTWQQRASEEAELSKKKHLIVLLTWQQRASEEAELNNNTSEACETFICVFTQQRRGLGGNERCQVLAVLSKGTNK